MARNRKIKVIIYAFLAVLLLVVAIISGQAALSAFAETVGYTSALSDLQKDSNFKASDYPDKYNDYSIKVIQIAESTGGELFVYTYQPGQKTLYLTATEVNMSLSESADGTKPYGLTLLNTSGVFGKYKVNDFAVSKNEIRYYNITSIYRDYIQGIDTPTGNDNEKLSKYFKVGKLFQAKTVGGDVEYACKDIDVVEIKNPYVDFVSYRDSYFWDFIFNTTGYTDVHYIAFSTDKKIDNLFEVDVTYTTRSYKYNTNDTEVTYGEKSQPKYKTITSDNSGSVQGGVFGSEKRSWKCIQRTEQFIETTHLNSAAKAEVEKSEFVLIFLETSYTVKDKWSISQGHSSDISGTDVSDIAILRLKFETDGKVYNLGALMDKLKGDDRPGNSRDPQKGMSFWQYIWNCIVKLFKGTASLSEQIVAIITLFVVLLVLPILIMVLSLVFPAVGAVVKVIFKGLWVAVKYLFVGLWYLITAPIRLIIWIINKIRGE